jgi:hypothetical protein
MAKGHTLLRAGSRAARAKVTIRGIPNRLLLRNQIFALLGMLCSLIGSYRRFGTTLTNVNLEDCTR